MREIPLLSSSLYVGPGARSEVGRTLRSTLPDARRVFLLTDKNCERYGRDVQTALRQSEFEVDACAIPPGETQKKLATAGRLHELLARKKFDRKSILVAVGGGVITDLGGFVASTYMRGITLAMVSTTLLGQVDASIGGKTAVNLPLGKNLVGTFYQPKAVFLDPTVLTTLPPREYVSGLGEVAKYVIIRDPELGEMIEREIDGIRKREAPILDEIVFRCASIKAEIVSQDEKESGVRAILNYGHTIGHALEAAGRYRTLHHGEAISIGMEAEAILSMELGIAPLEVLAAQNRLLRLCGLPTRVKRMARQKVLAAMKLDKKGADGRLRFVLPEAIGRVRWPVEVPAPLIATALRTITA